MPVGSSSTQLIILRGNSGSGKSSVAARLRQAYGRGVAVVPQDVVRRELLRERDRADAVNISLLDVMVRHILDNEVHVILEGIMYADRYGEMLTRLVREHAGKTFGYYFDVPYETTVERHELSRLEPGGYARVVRRWRSPVWRHRADYRARQFVGRNGPTNPR